MTNKKILAKVQDHEEKIVNAIYALQDFIQGIEDDEISVVGEEFCENLLDFIYSNDSITIDNVKELIIELDEHE